MVRTWRAAMVTMVMLTGTSLASGCGTAKEERQEEVKPQHLANMGELQEVVGVFHRDMRWSRFEQASLRVSPNYRPTFMGRYEEFGEDFHVTNLEVKSVKWDANPEKEETPRALVEVEQEWYKEPNMTIKKERFIEAWEPEGGGWMLTSRLKKDEWKAQEKARKEGKLPKKKASEQGQDGDSESSPKDAQHKRAQPEADDDVMEPAELPSGGEDEEESW